MSLEGVQRTLPDKERYLEHIGKYADGSARSKVANAVRRGVAGKWLIMMYTTIRLLRIVKSITLSLFFGFACND
jgi:hypothetical protein